MGLWECHKQFNGKIKRKNEDTIDDVIPELICKSKKDIGIQSR